MISSKRKQHFSFFIINHGDDQKQNYNITTWYNRTGTIEKTAHKLVRKDQQIGATIV